MATPDLHVIFYNHAKRALHDAYVLPGQVSNLTWDTMLPGGHGICEFNLRRFPGADQMLAAARMVEIRHGMKPCYVGRLADPGWAGDWINVIAFGGWEHMRQRLATLAYTATIYGNEVVEEALASCPLITANWTKLEDPGFDLDGLSWTNKPVQTIVQDVLQKGDDETPPRQWYFAAWDIDEILSETIDVDTILTSNQDNYDESNNANDYRLIGDVKAGNLGAGPIYLTAGLVFPSVNVPQGAVLKSADLTVVSNGVGGTAAGCHIRVYCEAADSAAVYTAGAPLLPRNRTKTSSYADWNPSAWVSGTSYTKDIRVPVQAIIDRPGFVSGNRINVILADNSSTSANYITIKSLDGFPASTATLTCTYYSGSVTNLTFRPYLFPRTAPSESTTDYLIMREDTVGGEINLARSLESLYNKVVARYGAGPSYTAAAEDTTSQALYDIRENDPDELDAGSSASVTIANNVRDLYLSRHKDPLWKTGDISVKRIRDRYGNFVHPATVRAGCVIRLVDFPTFDPDECRAFYVVRTQYDADSGVLTLSPEIQTDTLDILLSRLKEQN